MRRRSRPPETEAGFQRAIVEAAHALGWRVHHTRPARRADGQWRTPLQGDPGFPDLVLSWPGEPIIIAEVKTARGRLSQPQHDWISVLRQCAGIELYVWRPRDWPAIVAQLGQGASRKRRPPDHDPSHDDYAVSGDK